MIGVSPYVLNSDPGNMPFWTSVGSMANINATEIEIEVTGSLGTTRDIYTTGDKTAFNFVHGNLDFSGSIIGFTSDASVTYIDYGVIREGTDIYITENNGSPLLVSNTGLLDEWTLVISGGTCKLRKNSVLIHTFLTVPVGTYKVFARLLDVSITDHYFYLSDWS